MTKQDKIDSIVRRLVWADQRIATLTQKPDRKEKDYVKSAESEIKDLLDSISEDQRKIIGDVFLSKSFVKAKTVPEKLDLLINAPSPLDEKIED